MSDKSKITWTGATWNPVVGCAKVSPGCKNCYAERMAHRQAHMELAADRPAKYGRVISGKLAQSHRHGCWNGQVFCDEKALEIPLHWREPRRIFVCSMGDLFHPSVPFEFIDKVVEVFNKCPQHTGQFLTKRAERLLEYAKYRKFVWPDNVIGMVTAENQPMADLRIPYLLQCGFKTTGVSIEPMLGAIDLSGYTNMTVMCPQCKNVDSVDYFDVLGVDDDKLFCNRCGNEVVVNELDELSWAIVGGESGQGARPMHPDWPRNIRDQCKAAGVPFFFKQWGAWVHFEQMTAELQAWYDEMYGAQRLVKGPVRVGKKRAGCLLDGEIIQEYPQ